MTRDSSPDYQEAIRLIGRFCRLRNAARLVAEAPRANDLAAVRFEVARIENAVRSRARNHPPDLRFPHGRALAAAALAAETGMTFEKARRRVEVRWFAQAERRQPAAYDVTIRTTCRACAMALAGHAPLLGSVRSAAVQEVNADGEVGPTFIHLNSATIKYHDGSDIACPVHGKAMDLRRNP